MYTYIFLNKQTEWVFNYFNLTLTDFFWEVETTINTLNWGLSYVSIKMHTVLAILLVVPELNQI